MADAPPLENEPQKPTTDHVGPTEHVVTHSSPSRIGIMSVVAILAGVLLAGLHTMAEYGDAVSPEMVGAWIGTLLIPIGSAFAFSIKQRRLQWGRFAWVFLLAVVVCLNLANRGYQTTDQKVGDLFKQSAGSEPIDTTRDTPEIKIVRPILRDYIASLRSLSNDERCGDIQPPISSAASFESSRTISSSIAYLESCSAKEQYALALMDQFRNRTDTSIEASDLSQSRKKQWIESFNRGFDSSSQKVTDYVTAGQKWASARIDIYQFAQANRESYKVVNGELVFASDKQLREFNRLSDNAEALRKQYLAASEQYSQSSKDLFSKYGVTPQDLGVNQAMNR